jgi:hypothetical protein
MGLHLQYTLVRKGFDLKFIIKNVFLFFAVKRGDRRTGLTLSFREESEFSTRKVSKLYEAKKTEEVKYLIIINLNWLPNYIFSNPNLKVLSGHWNRGARLGSFDSL